MKKTIKKRAFVSAIAMLIVSAIVLTSSTFAWFSMSKEAKVEQMDLTVSSPEGIQISANASAWTASLTNDEIFNPDSTSRYKAYDGNVNLMPTDLKPVSSRFNGLTNGLINFYTASLADDRSANITRVDQSAANSKTAGLVAFDLFFKVANDTTVYFGTSEFEDTSSSDILSALRVGLQPMGNTQSTVAADATGLKPAAVDRANTKVYEVDSIHRSADAKAAGNSDGALGKSQEYVGQTGGVRATSDNFIFTGALVDTLYCTFIESTANNVEKSFQLKAGVTKMRIYIWVEGNDIDCRNSVAGAALTAALKFTID